LILKICLNNSLSDAGIRVFSNVMFAAGSGVMPDAGIRVFPMLCPVPIPFPVPVPTPFPVPVPTPFPVPVSAPVFDSRPDPGIPAGFFHGLLTELSENFKSVFRSCL